MPIKNKLLVNNIKTEKSFNPQAKHPGPLFCRAFVRFLGRLLYHRPVIARNEATSTLANQTDKLLFLWIS